MIINIPENDLGFMYCAFMRYAMGRRTYAPDIFLNVTKVVYPQFTDNHKHQLYDELSREIVRAHEEFKRDPELHHGCLDEGYDLVVWEDVLAFMEKHQAA